MNSNYAKFLYVISWNLEANRYSNGFLNYSCRQPFVDEIFLDRAERLTSCSKEPFGYRLRVTVVTVHYLEQHVTTVFIQPRLIDDRNSTNGMPRIRRFHGITMAIREIRTMSPDVSSADYDSGWEKPGHRAIVKHPGEISKRSDRVVKAIIASSDS